MVMRSGGQQGIFQVYVQIVVLLHGILSLQRILTLWSWEDWDLISAPDGLEDLQAQLTACRLVSAVIPQHLISNPPMILTETEWLMPVIRMMIMTAFRIKKNV